MKLSLFFAKTGIFWQKPGFFANLGIFSRCFFKVLFHGIFLFANLGFFFTRFFLGFFSRVFSRDFFSGFFSSFFHGIFSRVFFSSFFTGFFTSFFTCFFTGFFLGFFLGIIKMTYTHLKTATGQ